jgi:ABC-2 type transport system permease protein
MLGKVLGIGAVALTQIAIWGVLIVGFSMWVMPSLVAMAGTAAAGDAEAMAMLSAVSDAGGFAAIFGWMVLFLILGYLFYSALYAAIGSAVDNVQDASQLTVFTMIPILLGFVISMTVINDPGSTLAMWTSMIPFTSPMVMMARIPFGVPVWQILLSLVILVLSVWLVVQVAAKIYRVGIFMYGKKPSIKELVRWARYK